MLQIMEEELQRAMIAKGLPVSAPKREPGAWTGAVAVGLGGEGGKKKRRYDDVHEKEFARMDSIADHYSVKRATFTSKAIAPGSARRPRPSSSLASARRVVPKASASSRLSTLPPPADVSLEPRNAKRLRTSLAPRSPLNRTPSSSNNSIKSTQTQKGTAPTRAEGGSTSQGDADVEVKRKKATEDEEAAERLARKRKLAMAKARRSSVANQGKSNGIVVPTKPLPGELSSLPPFSGFCRFFPCDRRDSLADAG
jgi:hypothetical protein